MTAEFTPTKRLYDQALARVRELEALENENKSLRSQLSEARAKLDDALEDIGKCACVFRDAHDPDNTGEPVEQCEYHREKAVTLSEARAEVGRLTAEWDSTKVNNVSLHYRATTAESALTACQRERGALVEEKKRYWTVDHGWQSLYEQAEAERDELAAQLGSMFELGGNLIASIHGPEEQQQHYETWRDQDFSDRARQIMDIVQVANALDWEWMVSLISGTPLESYNDDFVGKMLSAAVDADIATRAYRGQSE